MLCKSCGTENSESSRFCKKCGMLLEEAAPSEKAPMLREEEKETIAQETGDVATEDAQEGEDVQDARVATVLKEKETSQKAARLRTSPLAVRVQEKQDREGEKIKKKLRGRRRWIFIAVIVTLLFLLENAVIISYQLGMLDDFLPKEDVPEADVPEINVPQGPPEETSLTTAFLYHYELVKYFDSNGSGNYDVVTETILSDGRAVFVDEGGDHLAVLVMPGQMTVDGVEQPLGNTPEAFSGWRSGETLNFQMKGNEQKFFAAGGSEPLVASFTPEAGQGRFDVTYDKVVSEMNMRYHLVITFTED